MSRYECAKKFAWRTIDEKVVILDTTSGDYFTLNETASVVWGVLMDGHGSAEAVDRLGSMFDVDSVCAANDAANLIASFTQDGFLVSGGSS